MDNTKLIMRARLFTTLVPSQKTVKLLKDVLAALEAAEAELTRRDTVIAGVWAWCRSHDLPDAPPNSREDWMLSEVTYVAGILNGLGQESADAPVSLEPANTTLSQVIADALGWDWESAPGVPSPVEAVSDVAAAVEQHLSLEAVKAETTTEWGVRWTQVDPPAVTDRGADEVDIRRLVQAFPAVSEAVVREVTEWRPVETEGDNRV